MGGKSTKPEVKKETLPVRVDNGYDVVRALPKHNGYTTQTEQRTTTLFNPFKAEEPRTATAPSNRSSGYGSGTSVASMSTTERPNGSVPVAPVIKIESKYTWPALSPPMTSAGTCQASGPSSVSGGPSTSQRPQEKITEPLNDVVNDSPTEMVVSGKRPVRVRGQRKSPPASKPANDSLPSLNKKMDSLAESLTALQLDSPGTEAVIVGRPRDGQSRIVQTIPKIGMSEWLILDAKSKNIAIDVPVLILPEIQAFIKVTKMSLTPPEDNPKFKYHVDEYYLQEIYNEPLGVELVAAVDTGPGVVTVVGNSFVKPTIVPFVHQDKPVKGGDFLIGNVYRLKPFFSSTVLQDVVCYVKNLEDERKYLEAVEKHKKNMLVCRPPRDPENMYYMTGVRTLFKNEYDRIGTNCRHMDVVLLQDANLYIRDVYIAIARLEKVTRLKSIEEHTLHVDGETTVVRSDAHDRISLTVRLTPEDVKRVILDKSQDTWRIGTDLSIRHPDLERHIVFKNEFTGQKSYEGGMTIDKIVHDKTTNKAIVYFRPHPRSFDLWDVVAKTKTDLKGTFTIGPSDDYIETIVETLQSGYFAEFVNRRELFDSWRGVKKNQKTVIADLNDPFDINGDPLDDSQRIALRTAMASPGFTCIEAPPGSGKTFLIAAMVAAKYHAKSPGVICISATTNNAISNAIDKTHDCYEMIKKTREYSKKMEEEINENSKKISLRQMALKAEDHIELAKHKDVSSSLESYKTCKKALKTIRNKEEGLALLDELQSADYLLRQSFLEAYRPYVTGSTCELVARRGDYIFRKIDKTENVEEKKRLKESAITHLILDEASQLPPHLALAVYIMLPGLQKVTLIGDSEQLGPYTPLDEKTFVFRMIGAGELSRVGGHAAVEKVHLRKVYRSHPRIVDLLLSPIYGPELKSGLEEDDRDLAREKNLPIAGDKSSPVLFVNIENAKNDKGGVNKKELNVVLDFIQVLKKKGVTGTDVAVVCNHHAQRQAIMDTLKGKGNIGVLNTSVAVHTVDSFQGKEAKVVLLLTTKVSNSSCINQTLFTLQFVSNPNRGCVAVSRGQHAVYLFGDWFNLVKTKFWSKFVPGIIRAEAMVNASWEPSSVEDYTKLKAAAQTAPQQFMNVGFGGRGTHKNTVHYNRRRAGHNHIGHVPHPHKKTGDTAKDVNTQSNNQRGGRRSRRGGRGHTRGQNGGPRPPVVSA